MKKYLFLALFSLLLLGTSNSFAINIPIYGKGGATVSGNGIKICPNFSLRKCGSINITWNDIKNWFADGIGTPPIGNVTIFDDEGNEIGVLNVQIIEVNPNLLMEEYPSKITGDDFIMKQY